MAPHQAVAERLAKLAPDQRAAATAPPGPVLCIAPAGSGKTTTLIARIAWLVDGGADPATICAISFNRRAAEELRERVAAALAPLGEGLGAAVRIRTFHALGMEILREAGAPVDNLLAREEILAAVLPEASVAERRRLDTVLSRFKLDLGVDPEAIRADPDAGPVARTFVVYEDELRRRGGLDFDDLVAVALRRLEADPAMAERWRARCRHLLVDESQDLDRAQLRLALLLAAPDNRIFLVGDDDQSIYGWRLADVRRLLRLADESLPGLRRVDLETNYRCPAVALARAVRLVEHNRERFAKVIRPAPAAAGRLVLAGSAADDVDRIRAVLASWPRDEGTLAVLARTNRELLPAAVAALQLGLAFRAPELQLPVESPIVDEALAELAGVAAPGAPAASPALALARLRSRPAPDDGARERDGAAEAEGRDDPQPPPETTWGRRDVLAALLGWSVPFRSVAELAAAVAGARAALAALRRDDAPLTLATAHGTKGLEFDHVAVIGLDDGRFPSARSVAESAEPERALEEERRLAYVAWTRPRRSLTLVYDPGAASTFLLEAFTRDELGVSGRDAR